MTDDRYQRGADLLTSIQGPDAVTQLTALDDTAPGFSDFIIASGFGELYQREGLDVRERLMVNVVVLAAIGGADAYVRDHIRGALQVGAERTKIVESLVQIGFYAGMPRTVAALRIARLVFDEDSGTEDQAD